MNGEGSFDAALLAGGRSTRFGSDKAFLDWRGTPLFARQLGTLAALGPGRTWLSANAAQEFPGLPQGVEVVVDEEPDLGPIGGLLSVFRRSEAERIVVLGVDLPLMEPSFLERLLSREGGTVPKSDRYWEPLAAVYPREGMIRLLEEALASGERKLQRVLDEAEGLGVVRSYPCEESDHLLFTNLNSTREMEAVDPNRFDEHIRLRRFRKGEPLAEDDDFVAAEEPLEVRVNGRSVAVMMRTPGHDEELAIGFLFTEGVIDSADEILSMEHVEELDLDARGNVLEISLKGEPDLDELTRHVFTSSSCGVCGKATIESVFRRFPPVVDVPVVAGELLLELPGKLRAAQETFERTGGLHASALFSRKGDLLLLREDVGRHNALDKVIGCGLRGKIDFSGTYLLVSGRISFELMQKALAARIPVVAGISAPSSLAVDLARESGQTLVGFLRGKGGNVYSGEVY